MLSEEFGLNDAINLHGKEEELVWMGEKAIHFWAKGQQSKGCPRMHVLVFYKFNNCLTMVKYSFWLTFSLCTLEAKQMGMEFWKDQAEKVSYNYSSK